MRALFLSLLLLAAPAALAVGGVFTGADVVLLGEQHDNPHHHMRQAKIVSELQPSAVVYEMLTPEQAARATPDLISSQAGLEAALGWNESGWPDFEMYYPIFAAAPKARIYGAAIPRQKAHEVMQSGIGSVFSGDLARFGLDRPLDSESQERREILQAEAHCNALPEDMLPIMVEIQRLRDAELARVALQALEDTGGPVVVITGNGHARADWGAPAFLRRVAPGLRVATLGQGETASGPPSGDFDMVEIGPDVDRGDPCAAFR